MELNKKTACFFCRFVWETPLRASTELLCKILRHPIFGSNSQEGLPVPPYLLNWPTAKTRRWRWWTSTSTYEAPIDIDGNWHANVWELWCTTLVTYISKGCATKFPYIQSCLGCYSIRICCMHHTVPTNVYAMDGVPYTTMVWSTAPIPGGHSRQ